MCSIRVSNELGAAHGHKANFSVVVGAIYSSLLGLAMALILMITRNQYPDLFSDSEQVKQLVSELTPLIGVNIVISSVQASLSGTLILCFVICFRSQTIFCVLWNRGTNDWMKTLLQGQPLEQDGKHMLHMWT